MRALFIFTGTGLMPNSTSLHAGTQLTSDACEALDTPRALLLTQDANGVITLYSHGFASHAHINSVLSVGIHANLSDHDRYVELGAAGEDAARVALSI